MKILVVAVFSSSSTNNSQARGFKHNGHEVIRYNYRRRVGEIGYGPRNQEIVDICRDQNVDLVFFSKCNGVENRVISDCNKYAKTCFWYMDPLNANWNDEAKGKTRLATFACFDKEIVLKEAKKLSPHCYHVVEGYDHLIDKPYDLDKIYDLTFIGSIREHRGHYQKILGFSHFDNAHGSDFAKVTSQSKINLNFVTNQGASDRVYKVMGAGGFLLTEDWMGRDSLGFVDGQHLAIFRNEKDAKETVAYYLKNEEKRKKIAKNGYEIVQQYNRDSFAKRIVEIAKQI